MKILIIEDELDLLKILSEEIADLGHEVIEVHDIQAAEHVWKGCVYALIDTMEGSYEFAKKLKNAGVKTISFTGFNKIKPEYIEFFDGSLHKPWEDDELSRLLK